MYENILVPLDGSKTSEAALPCVEELVSKLRPEVKAQVTLFQAVPSMGHWVVGGEEVARVPYTETEMEQIKSRAMDYMEKAAEDLRSKGATVNCKVGVGRPAEQIITVADEIKADLVAMSTHGRSGFSQLAFGSVTAKVLRGGHSPVLMVRTLRDTAKT